MHPFHRSIHVRFQYAFGVAALGLAVMAMITIVSGRILLNTYESSVTESRYLMVPVHDLQVLLREADHLVYRYAIENDQSAPSQFSEIRDAVDAQLRRLTEAQSLFAGAEHAHSRVSLPETGMAWQSALAAVQDVFSQAAGSPEATAALEHAHLAIDPIYDAISELHRLSMQDMQNSLAVARSEGGWAFATIFAAILVGLGLLIVMGITVGRSVLHPIAQLQGAARKLGMRDFSHRVTLRNKVDELGQLGRAFNVASATLNRLYVELEQRSTHDGLTGALNRAAFDDRLSVECTRADRQEQSLSLLMVDIDLFKDVNDTYGHQAGDRVLQALIQMLNEATRPDDVVARYGGEEFAIILPQSEEVRAMALAERLRAMVEDYCVACDTGEDINITISIGCATRLPHLGSAQDLVKAADTALYRAKRLGRNRVEAAGMSASGKADGEHSRTRAA